jgi:protein arginine kinase activator
VSKVHFCEKCAAKNNVLASTLSPVAHALAALHQAEAAEAEDSAPVVVCPQCGFKSSDFNKAHRLGCPECYKVFTGLLGELLPKLQPGGQHHGKMPGGKTLQNAVREALDAARKNMRTAIDTEAYEDAARLRDEIQQLEEVLSGVAATG